MLGCVEGFVTQRCFYLRCQPLQVGQDLGPLVGGWLGMMALALTHSTFAELESIIVIHSCCPLNILLVLGKYNRSQIPAQILISSI